MPTTIIENGKTRMQQTVEVTKKEFSHIRTGRANPAILDQVMIEYYGVPTPLTQIAGVSAPEAQLIVIKPYDKTMLTQIEKAIHLANLGFNPANDGVVIRISIPPLTENTRKDLVKNVKKMAEESKIAIRNIRRDVIDHLKKLEKDSLISEDELKRHSENVQKMTDKFIESIDVLAVDKEKMIMTI
jgi:ribosome recycling factor